MITIFCGTNRRNGRTRLITDYIYGLLVEQSTEEVRYFNLEDLPSDMLHADMYSEEGQSDAVAKLQDTYVVPADKFIFVVPEYNGGIPGALKLFLDACSVRKYKESFHGGKKAGLIGISAGRSGNSRGLEYMTGFLNYLQIQVMPNKLPLSSIEQLLKDDALEEEGAQKALSEFVEQFINF